MSEIKKPCYTVNFSSVGVAEAEVVATFPNTDAGFKSAQALVAHLKQEHPEAYVCRMHHFFKKGKWQHIPWSEQFSTADKKAHAAALKQNQAKFNVGSYIWGGK